MRKKRGSLLIEVIFSISLLAIIAFYALPIFYQSMAHHILHREQEEIVMAAQNQMEKVLAHIYQDKEIFLSSDEKYQYEVIKDFKNNLWHITLKVKEKSNERTVTLETYAKAGIYTH